MGKILKLEVPTDEAGNRLDRYLTDRVAGCTRSALRRLIVAGRVRVDGSPASKPGFPIERGMRVEVELPSKPSGGPRPESIALSVVHEDDDLLVVDKPAGMVVHPGHGHREGTLVNALLGLGVALAATGGPDRPGIVHRLDAGTSGLLLVAKTDAAYHGLVSAFSLRQVHKLYLALVWGRADPAQGTIERSIGRSRSDPLKMSVHGRGSRVALSHYRTVESLPGFSLLEVRPETGRTHQIRVHLQSIHHPIVGDARYGGRPWRGVQDPRKRKALKELDRLALHASALSLSHPTTGRELQLTAPLPPALETLLRTLRA